MLLALALATPCLAHAQMVPSAMDVVDRVVAASKVLRRVAAYWAPHSTTAVFVDEGLDRDLLVSTSSISIGSRASSKKLAERRRTQFAATASAPTVAQIKPDSAYIVVPMELNAHVGSDKRFHETGLFTFTLVQQSGMWKITSQVWDRSRNRVRKIETFEAYTCISKCRTSSRTAD